MQITVNLMDVLVTLLILVGVALGIFLIVLVVRMLQTVKHLSRLTSDLHDPLTQTVNQLPDLIRRIDSLSSDVAILTKSANENVPDILVDAKAITGTARAGVEIVSTAADDISSGVASFFSPAKESPDNVSSIIEIVNQVLQIVGLFTQSRKANNRKTSKRRRSKR